MTENGTEARAARLAARGEPVKVTLGDTEFVFEPDMPLDVVMSLDTLNYVTTLEARIWVEAHIVPDVKCDTSCAEDGLPLLARNCAAEDDMRARLKRVRAEDGSRLPANAFHDFHDEVLAKYAVTEGESSPSPDSSETGGGALSATASATA